MKVATHFIEVYKSTSTGKQITGVVRNIGWLPFALNGTKNAGCKTIIVWKIYPKEIKLY